MSIVLIVRLHGNMGARTIDTQAQNIIIPKICCDDPFFAMKFPFFMKSLRVAVWYACICRVGACKMHVHNVQSCI